VAAICHKFINLEGKASSGGLGRASLQGDKNFDAIYTVKQPYKSTLMFNVLPGTEISVHAEFSHCRQNCYYGLQAIAAWQ